MAIQIKRRIDQDGAPTTSHLTADGQLGYHRPLSAPSDDLYIRAGTTVRTLVSRARQVETSGDQPINGDKTFNGHSTFVGDVTIQKDPVQQTDGANRRYVDNAVAQGGGGFQERWNPVTNIPNVITATKHNGYYWIADVAGATTVAIPGIGIGTQFNPGDWIIWEEHNSEFAKISGGGMTEQEADTRYLQLSGGTVANLTIGTTTTPGDLHVTGDVTIDGTITVNIDDGTY